MSKERPIIFTAESIKAILDGRKTQTRRVIKPQPERGVICKCPGDNKTFSNFEMYQDYRKTGWIPIGKGFLCPYGQAGDRLWLREAFVVESDIGYDKYPESEIQQWAKDRPVKTEEGGFDLGTYHLIPHYRATEPEPNIVSPSQDTYDDKTHWKPSIFMPRWASRILLEITEVRVERVQEITERDAFAESPPTYEGMFEVWRDCFKVFWDFIDATRGYGWERNPWVWVISFKMAITASSLFSNKTKGGEQYRVD